MNTEQYLKQVAELLRLQVKNKTIFSEEQLKDFRMVKPVPLGIQMIEVLNEKYKHPDKVDVYDFEKKIALTGDYPHLKEVLDALRRVYLADKRELDASRVLHKKSFIENNVEQFCEVYDKLELLCKEILEGSEATAEEVQKLLYIVEDVVALCILTNYDEKYNKLFEEPNMGFLIEELQEKESKFILLEGPSNACLVELLAAVLAEQGKEVFLFKAPLCYEEEGINIADTVGISVENFRREGNLTYVYPIKVISKTKGAEDNISYLLEYVNNHYNAGGHINVIGQGYQIGELSERPFTNKKMTRLSEYYYDKREYNLTLARYGDYLTYISKVHKEDCKELLYKEPTVQFSIVIPVRDSVATLQYAIKTCIEQTYTGDYEIVISDNSVKNTDVYEFCKKLDNPRVKYIRTPRSLDLVKSFEFAYLHTSGRYIISLGADDGVLPWALDILSEVVNRFPDELVIGWPRGFYAWPGFSKIQEHQLLILGLNEKKEWNTYYTSADTYLERVLDNPHLIYSLPLLYINSCFKRDLLYRLYDVVGELFAGCNQDISTGILMTAMNKKILNVSMPLTIAGMSSVSVGANYNNEKEVKVTNQKQEELSVGTFVFTEYEHYIPFVGTDVAAVYLSIMRAASKGLFSKREIYARIDWKRAFIQMLESKRIDQISYYGDIYKARYAAALHGEEFLKWFDETIVSQKMQLCVVDDGNISQERVYKTGMDGYGNLCLDASEYNVNNIYDAVKLFEKVYTEWNVEE